VNCGEASRKIVKLPKDAPRKPVNRWMIADNHQVGVVTTQEPQQFELLNIRVLEFVDEE